MENESKKMESSFVFQQSFFETALVFSGKDFEKFLSLLIKYGLYGEEPDFSTVSQRSQLAASASFIQIRQRIDASKRRYQAAVENGKRGGRPKNGRKKPDPKPELKPERKPVKYQNGNQSENQTQNLNYKDNDNTLGNYHYLKDSSSTSGDVIASPPPNPKEDELGREEWDIPGLSMEEKFEIIKAKTEREQEELEAKKKEEWDETHRLERERREKEKREKDAYVAEQKAKMEAYLKNQEKEGEVNVS